MITAKAGKLKEDRLNIRTTAEKKAIIVKAAEKENKNISDFVLENALFAAEAVLADNAIFNLSQDKWQLFVAALDAPPRKIPALRKLLTSRSVFDVK